MAKNKIAPDFIPDSEMPNFVPDEQAGEFISDEQMAAMEAQPDRSFEALKSGLISGAGMGIIGPAEIQAGIGKLTGKSCSSSGRFHNPCTACRQGHTQTCRQAARDRPKVCGCRTTTPLPR